MTSRRSRRSCSRTGCAARSSTNRGSTRPRLSALVIQALGVGRRRGRTDERPRATEPGAGQTTIFDALSTEPRSRRRRQRSAPMLELSGSLDHTRRSMRGRRQADAVSDDGRGTLRPVAQVPSGDAGMPATSRSTRRIRAAAPHQLARADASELAISIKPSESSGRRCGCARSARRSSSASMRAAPWARRTACRPPRPRSSICWSTRTSIATEFRSSRSEVTAPRSCSHPPPASSSPT